MTHYLHTASRNGIACTERQGAVYDFIAERIRGGCPPSVREIGAEFGMSPNGVVCHLRALVRKGLIHRVPLAARGIRLGE